MRANKEQDEKSGYHPESEILRVSKSSLMTYMKCPRQFYWDKVSGVPRPPKTDEMIRGTDVHEIMEVGMLQGPDAMYATATEMGLENDPGVVAMSDLLNMIAKDFGGLKIEEAEVKHLVYEEYEGHKIVWVGIIDAVLRHPDGGLIIAELKTGNMNVGKLSRTRKELVYYARLLEQLNYDEVTHFLYITPDYEVPDKYSSDKLLEEANKRGKSVWVGDEYGIAIMEPISSRSINAFTKSLSIAIDSLKSQQYPMKWSDYFCPQWCNYHLSCEGELSGLEESILGE
tara:strand:- start:9910 stop:10764 length:855 start_codon:yes stop_codon:yes gene_type:complete